MLKQMQAETDLSATAKKRVIQDRASKELFVEFMSKEQSDPEIALQDILNDMLDNRKYRAYTDPQEWLPFFTAMSKIVK